MDFSPFKISDLENLQPLEPPGWGNLIPRFQYFLDNSFCQPVALKINGKLAAVGTSILHADTAWFATIIVHTDYRGNGYGKAITEFLINNLNSSVYKTIYLEATDAGYPIYQKIGFEVESEYLHFKRTDLLPAVSNKHCVPFDENYRNAILEMDQFVSCENRSNNIEPHISNAVLYLKNKQLVGYYLPSLADIPIIALNVEAGLEMMRQRMSMKNYATVAVENRFAQEFLLSNGFEYFRNSRRMFLGVKREIKFTFMFNRISGQLG